MDDVLFDNSGEIFRFHNLPYPYEDENNFGRYDCHNLVGYHHDQMWGNLPESYWENLPKLPWTDLLVEWCMDCVGDENVFILGYPINFKECSSGKAKSIAKHWPELSSNLILTKAKYACVGTDGLLIDDSEKNEQDFIKHGKEENFFLFPSKLNWKYHLMKQDENLLIFDILQNIRTKISDEKFHQSTLSY